MTFRPLLAATVDPATPLRFPLWVSPKLDGIRAIVIDGIVMSRSMKPIPNLHTQAMFGRLLHYDGELIVGSPTSKSCYRDTMSGVMSVMGKPNVWFFAFDHIRHGTEPFAERYKRLKAFPNTYVLEHTLLHDEEELTKYEQVVLRQGYEGVMLRDPRAIYKQGRSTLNEGYLMKLKRFADGEAVVTGFKEHEHNANPATINELGKTKRSSHKANKIPTGKLGALEVEWEGIEFDIGTGFTDEQRTFIWKNRLSYYGQIAKFKYLAVGMKHAPRHPVWLGFRSKLDL